MKGINVLEKAATEIRIGDNLAFAGGTIGVGKSFSHIDDAFGKTVAKVEGKVDGVLDDLADVSEKVHHTEIPKWNSKKMLSKQQGIEEALSKNKMTLTELDHTNTLASKLDVEGKKAIHTEITQAQKVASDMGLPQSGEKIVKVSVQSDPFYLDSDNIPSVKGCVAREVDVKSLNTLEEHIEGLGLNYSGSEFMNAERFTVDIVPVDEAISKNVDHTFNRPPYVSELEPPYTNTGFTSGGTKEFHIEAYLKGDEYVGHPLTDGTIRLDCDSAGNVVDSAEWRVITDVDGNKYGNWLKLNSRGKHTVPVVNNKQGGVLIEPIKK